MLVCLKSRAWPENHNEYDRIHLGQCRGQASWRASARFHPAERYRSSSSMAPRNYNMSCPDELRIFLSGSSPVKLKHLVHRHVQESRSTNIHTSLRAARPQYDAALHIWLRLSIRGLSFRTTRPWPLHCNVCEVNFAVTLAHCYYRAWP